MKLAGEKPSRRRSVLITEPALDLLASSPSQLSAAGATLMWHLVKTLPPAGSHLSLTAVADSLGLSRVQVTKAMHKLLQLGCLVRGPKDGVLYLYRLNPAFFQPL